MSDDLDEFIDGIYELERSPTKLAMIEEAVRRADALQDVEMGYELRSMLVEEAIFGGRPEVAMVAFGWLLAKCDADPESFDEEALLWQYKWVTAFLPEFHGISLEQIEATIGDMARRFAKSGEGERAVHLTRCRVALAAGDPDALEREYKNFKAARRDSLSDCAACETSATVEMFAMLGRDQEALKLAKPILAGRQSCAEVPHVTYALLLEPLVRLGRAAEAVPYHERGYRMTKGDLTFLSTIAKHIRFDVLIDKPAAAVRKFTRHLPLALMSNSPLPRLEFFVASLFLFRRLAKPPKSRLKIALPADFPHASDDGRPDLVALRDWFETESRALARLFDARSGNDYRMRQIDRLEELEALITPVASDESD